MTEYEYSSDGVIHDNLRLKELQAMSLDRKIMITQSKIIEWYYHFNGNVYISFSGGKDSTVLLDIARKIFPDIPAVFSNTGLEYPEVRKFATSFENVETVYPQMTFFNVVKTYGYPIISKEVSEAIYYARRIKNSEKLLGERPQGSRKNYWDSFLYKTKSDKRTVGEKC
ncbi:MAG: phosphoadenosine phosphosulfate reductase family protein [Ruminococcus flavefaciens]|nr:phosphoadenosine phosphosulfate reductase family protein [Ruminococcus flavefaciens]MCM1060738.1 phosphoadenosine phosphosulfate reductase family protein [Eubacterium sp.]